MTFYRGTPTFISYSLQNTPLDRIYSVNDLGVFLDPELKFNCHIMSTVNKAMSVLGFIKNLMTLIYLNYYLPPLSVLFFEYCSSVCSPQYQVHIDLLSLYKKICYFCPA